LVLSIQFLPLRIAEMWWLSHPIGNSLIVLFDNPDTFAEVRADHTLAPKVVEESLRYWSPVHLVFQNATQDIELHNTIIPGSSYVMS